MRGEDELYNNLMFPDGTHFYPDKQGDDYGFNTDAARGADTFRPFNLIKKLKIIKATPLNGINNNNSQYAASNAIDGTTQTSYLCNSSTGPEIVFTLEKESRIKEVRLLAVTAATGDSPLATITIWGSKDNTSFQQLTTVSCPNFVGSLIKNIVLSVIPINLNDTYKYIKLSKNGTYSGFAEVEIWGC